MGSSVRVCAPTPISPSRRPGPGRSGAQRSGPPREFGKRAREAGSGPAEKVKKSWKSRGRSLGFLAARCAIATTNQQEVTQHRFFYFIGRSPITPGRRPGAHVGIRKKLGKYWKSWEVIQGFFAARRAIAISKKRRIPNIGLF